MVLPIPRVKPTGWGLFEILTSSQETQLDLNISLLDQEVTDIGKRAIVHWTGALYSEGGSAGSIKFLEAMPFFGLTLPSRRPNAIVSFGTSGSDQTLSISPDGNHIGTFEGFGTNFLSCVAIDRTPTGTIFGGIASFTALRYSLTNGETFSSIEPGNLDVIQAVHFTPAGNFMLFSADGNAYRSALVNGSYTPIAFIGSTDTTFQVVDNTASGGVTMVAAVHRAFSGSHYHVYVSNDDGLSWGSGHDFGGHQISLTYNASWGLFVVLTDTGEIWTAPAPATAWTLLVTVADLAGHAGGHGQMASCGAAIAHIINRLGIGSFNIQAAGVAYSFDLGHTWQEVYFGECFGAGPVPLKKLLSANSQLFACDDHRLYRSLPLETPQVLYNGA